MAVCVRYAQGGGLTDRQRAVRERTRLEAVERFARGEKNSEIAEALRVTERSVERWRRAWRERGEAGVVSKGSPGRPRLGPDQVARLGGNWSVDRLPMAGRTSDGR
jgi:transposase-like protein